MAKIKDKIIKSEKIEWKKLKQLQSDNFKEMTKSEYDALKNSIVKNDFVESFKVWENDNNIYVLDGVHRTKMLRELEKEGHEVPERFTAYFVECKDIKEAAKLVTIYSSRYAKVVEEGFYEFLNDYKLDINSLKDQIDIPDINLDKFQDGYFEEPKEKELDENINTENQCPSCGYKW